jgi:transglutaminase-like putative cysteine protease
VHDNVTFGYQHARGDRTACDVFYERRGVCRDFAHLAIAFCRAMNIPARYASGYLGDIGVPPDPAPMDFSAWFEVYLGGRWHAFDARHNRPRIGRILMVRGRDATDAAITTAFGDNSLLSFRVWTDELHPDRPLPEVFRTAAKDGSDTPLMLPPRSVAPPSRQAFGPLQDEVFPKIQPRPEEPA